MLQIVPLKKQKKGPSASVNRRSFVTPGRASQRANLQEHPSSSPTSAPDAPAVWSWRGGGGGFRAGFFGRRGRSWCAARAVLIKPGEAIMSQCCWCQHIPFYSTDQAHRRPPAPPSSCAAPPPPSLPPSLPSSHSLAHSNSAARQHSSALNHVAFEPYLESKAMLSFNLISFMCC